MIAADETFDGTWPWAPRFSTAPGFRMHHVDEGEGDVVVCLHGQPTWGYLYREILRALAPDHRVVVPDHMGFGKSETPADRDYTLATHVANLAALVEELDLRDITFVGQDWGGVMACNYAARHPERVRRLFLMNTTSGLGRVEEVGAQLIRSRWFRWVTGGEESGRTDAVLSQLGTTVLSVMRLMGLHRREIDDTWLRAYGAPFPDPESCRGALAFPRDVSRGTAGPYLLEGRQHVGALAAKPAILVEGLADTAIPPAVAMADFRSVWPDAPIVPVEGAGHFLQEDAPEVMVATLRAFLGLT